MKLKYYLRGLGIGILVTAAILTIVYHTKGSMTDAQIKKRAAELGMVMTSEQEDTLFSKEPTSEETTIAETTAEEVTTEEPTTEGTTTEEVTTEAPTEAPTEPPATEPVVNEAVLTITQGMYSESVAAELARLGIISSQKEFNAYLVNNGYAERIQTGDFRVRADMSYDEIARIITRS